MPKRSVITIAFVFLAAVSGGEEPYTVIVNPANPATQIKRSALAVIFKKEMVRWNDGSPIVPVDQSARAPVRSAFSNLALGEPVVAVLAYWQRRMAQGRLPPVVKSSDDEVVAFVRANRGAIGYVSAQVTLDGTVKSLKLVD